jgi:sec-independent protein translocase protein TatC
LVVPFLVLAIGGSIAGALFSHYVLFPGMMTFFGAFDSPRMRFMPRVEDTFALYKSTLTGMVVVFQIPTLVFVLARLGLVSARFLWRHLRYAVLAAVTVSAFLTPSPDPWNQLVFAAPMIGMYVMGIGIAWLAHPKTSQSAGTNSSPALGLVIAAGVFEQARRRRQLASTR